MHMRGQESRPLATPASLRAQGTREARLTRMIFVPFLVVLTLATIAVLLLARSGEPGYVLPDEMEIEVVGNHFRWEVHYPGPDGVLRTADDEIGHRNVHVPVGTPTTIHLRSRDYIYGFALPELGLKEIAVPDLEFSIHVPARAAGSLELRGNQMCGYTHPELLGLVLVQSRHDYVQSVREGAR
jgi:heme/copper-type cytochrome/quinol oxidase subunit 2